MEATQLKTALKGEVGMRLARCIAGWDATKELEVTPVRGGSNNRLFRLAKTGEAALCAKVYRRGEGGASPRFSNERLFYETVQDAVSDSIPGARRWDENEHIALFEWLQGALPKEIDQDDIESAGRFVRSLQRAGHISSIGPASDACWSEAAHLSSVETRIKRLESLAVCGALATEVVRVIVDEILPSWHRVRRELYSAATTQFSDLVLSPSDFGFHNALKREDGRWCFFDFEYAGIDDPAKLLCDLVARPGPTLPPDALEGLCLHAGFSAEVKKRALRFLHLHKLKWACILIWRLTPEGVERGAFADCTEDSAAVLHTVSELAKQGA